MSHLFLVGTGPLFSPEVKVFNGQALRTWHFTQPLRKAGHQVDLVVLPPEGTPNPSTSAEPYERRERDGFSYLQLAVTSPETVLSTLQSLLDAAPYDAIVAVNHNAAAYVCRLSTQLPIWADLNGYIMGEAQAKCRVYSSDSYLQHFWKRQCIALRRADRFSAVSHKQMYATLGELGTLGRLNQYTFSHPFVSVVPNAASEEFLALPARGSANRFRGELFPQTAFAVLWSGGFNTWTDTRTLAAALSLCMELSPDFYFISTGGIIPGHDEKTYEAFLAQMSETGFRDRCRFLGWVEASELLDLYRECDLGINIDSLNYETMFGARNRLTNMMAAGLPVLTTLGTEISEIVDENGLGYVVPIGDTAALAEALIQASIDPDKRVVLGRKARRFAETRFSYTATTRALVRWAANPTLAPDNQAKKERWPGEKLLASRSLSSLEAQASACEHPDNEELARCRAELNAIRSKPLFQLYKLLFSWRTKGG